MTQTLFGTDGIRGRTNTYPIDAETLLKIGISVGSVIGKKLENPKVIIGKDTRRSGYMVENALTAGLIGGIGGAKCRTAAAHAIHNALTQLTKSNKALHGELVGYGILVQLTIEEMLSESQLAKQSKKQLISFLKKLKLPLSLRELGFSGLTLEELKNICYFACQERSEIHNLPFKINPEILIEAINIVESIEQVKSQKKPINKII